MIFFFKKLFGQSSQSIKVISFGCLRYPWLRPMCKTNLSPNHSMLFPGLFSHSKCLQMYDRHWKKSLSKDMSFLWKPSFPFLPLCLKTLWHLSSPQSYISKHHHHCPTWHPNATARSSISAYLVPELVPPVPSSVPSPNPWLHQPIIPPFAPQENVPLPNSTCIIATKWELAKTNLDCHSSTSSIANSLQGRSPLLDFCHNSSYPTSSYSFSNNSFSFNTSSTTSSNK